MRYEETYAGMCDSAVAKINHTLRQTDYHIESDADYLYFVSPTKELIFMESTFSSMYDDLSCFLSGINHAHINGGTQ